MIITSKFAFIHLHKTGGQTLNDAIVDCIAKHEVVGYHFPRSLIPAESSHLPIVGIVRNPWSWYVSWYFFNRRPNIHNSLFKVVSEDGHADFSTTVRNLIKLGSDDQSSRQQRDMLISILPDTLDGNRGVGLTKSDIRDLSESGEGYYTWLFDRMLGIERDDATLIGHFENLHDDFMQIMRQLGVAEVDAIDGALSYGKRKNTSRHSHYSHYFDEELRQLVASKEQRLIERFDYRFDAVGPAYSRQNAKSAPAANVQQGFRKLLGRAENFLLVNTEFDAGPLADKVLQLTDDQWAESDRKERFYVHRDTQSLALIQFVAHSDSAPETQPLYVEFEKQLRPVIRHIANFYQDNGFVLRILLAKLRAGGKIEEHVDTGFSLLTVHRIHVPLITNDDTVFHVGGEETRMRAGEFWEIDNSRKHAVENDGVDDRVHMIVDWMPNHSGLGQEAALHLVKSTTVARDGESKKSLEAMTAQAYEAQRAGQPHKAEARYRYVLDIDPDNVVCNNLMGMLCRQLRRYDEAIQYIQTAIAAAPGDAKAHVNLGQAFLMQGNFAAAVDSFQNALAHDGNLQTAQVGLQRAQLELHNMTNKTSGSRQ